MPGDGLAHGPPAKRKLAAVTTGSAGSPGIPCAMVLTVSFALSPGTGLFCSRRARDHHLARLTSASGGQDHTTSPSVSASLVWRDRYVHRSPASRVVTIAIRPLHRGGMERDNHEILKNGIEIFFAQGLDGGISIESPCEFRFFAHGISAHDDGVLRDQSGQHCPSGESGAPRTALALPPSSFASDARAFLGD